MNNTRTLLTSLGAAAIAAGLALSWADAPPPATPAIAVPTASMMPGGGAIMTDGMDDLFGDQLAPLPDLPAEPPGEPPPAEPPTERPAVIDQPPSKAQVVKTPRRPRRLRPVRTPARKSTATRAPTFRPGHRWRLFGNTPTAAWSPDSLRLAVNSAFNYLDDSHRGAIEVLDVLSGGRKLVHTGPAYHPLWLDDDRIVFGCSVYECDDYAGLWLANGADGPALRIKEGTSVYHTLFAGKDKVLFWSGFPGYAGWRVFNTRTGKDNAGQCRQKVGKMAARSNSRGVEVRFGRGRWTRVSEAPSYSVGWGRSGPVQPCISPDGRRIAYFTTEAGQPAVGTLELEAGQHDPSAMESLEPLPPRPQRFTVRNTWRLFSATPTAVWSPKGDSLAVAHDRQMPTDNRGAWVEVFDVKRGVAGQARRAPKGLRPYGRWQCRSKAEGVSVRADSQGLHVRHGSKGEWEQVLTDPAMFVGGEVQKHVKPCLSPDGRRIAHFIRVEWEPTVAILELEHAKP